MAAFAQLWAALHQQRLSKQAVQKRFGPPAVRFLQAILQSLLAARLRPMPLPRSSLFGRILLQDSTCLRLPPKLAGLFPGAANQHQSGQAGLKIQATLDLLKNQWTDFQLTPFTRNDQAAAADILCGLRPADLLIRDLGYLVLDVLRQIHQQGAYFLTRWRYGLIVRCPQSGAKLSLGRMLPHCGPLWEADVWLGEQRLPVRLVALRLPEVVANERRRKARLNRDRRCHPNQEYLQLLGWNLYLTNVAAAELAATDLAELYSLRWRIETVFKAWKTHFHLEALTEVSVHQLLIVILGKLIWICCFSAHWLQLVAQGKDISLLKLAQWWSRFAIALSLSARPASPLNLWDQMTYYCAYDKRKDRLNFLQKFARLG